MLLVYVDKGGAAEVTGRHATSVGAEVMVVNVRKQLLFVVQAYHEIYKETPILSKRVFNWRSTLR